MEAKGLICQEEEERGSKGVKMSRRGVDRKQEVKDVCSPPPPPPPPQWSSPMIPWLAAVRSWAIDEPTVFDVAASSSAQLSTVSPGRGSSWPVWASTLASAVSCERLRTVSIALSISKDPHISDA